MKRKCSKPNCGSGSKPGKIDYMAGFVSLGIVFLCAYALAVAMVWVEMI